MGRSTREPLSERIVWWARPRDRRVTLAPAPDEGHTALITALDAAASAISAAPSVRDVLSTIVTAAKQFTGTDKVVVCLVDEYEGGTVLDETTLVVRGSREQHAQEWWGNHLAEVTDWAFEHDRPFFSLDRVEGAWLLAVPVRILDKPIGILIAMNSQDAGLQPAQSAFLSILGTFAAVAIANARLVDETRYAMLANERERIARDMHDGITQSLFSISLGMELCKKQVARGDDAAVATLEELQAQLAASTSELRRLIYDLRPMKLKEQGLVAGVEAWMREATRGSGIQAVLRVSGEPRRLTGSQELCIYRVAKEAVSNAVHHSGASQVSVEIGYDGQSVILTVEDDGSGFVVGETTAHLRGRGEGMRNMYERMRAEGGTLEVSSALDEGTLVRAVLPIGAA